MPQQLLQLLMQGERCISGEEISRQLGISRAAVWKRIRSLRDKGFGISAVSGRGYCLDHPPELSGEYISASLQGNFWKEILVYKTVDSTNEVAHKLVAEGRINSGSVIIADRQGKGRGRLGRAWASPPERNIYMSIVLKPDFRPRDATLITILAAVACTLALREISGLELTIKWPNDLTFGGKKLGGILTELRSDPDKITMAVIGIGLNINIKKDELPADLCNIATSLMIANGKPAERNRVIIRVLEEMESWYMTFLKEGRGPLLNEWKRLSHTLGMKVKVTMQHDTIVGEAIDINDEGMLILKLSGGKFRTISSGDITHLRGPYIE